MHTYLCIFLKVNIFVIFDWFLNYLASGKAHKLNVLNIETNKTFDKDSINIKRIKI